VGHRRRIADVQVLRGGRFLATGSDDGLAVRWDGATRHSQLQSRPAEAVGAAALMLDDHWFVVGSGNGSAADPVEIPAVCEAQQLVREADMRAGMGLGRPRAHRASVTPRARCAGEPRVARG
jgi:hypothetical protein